MDTYQLLLQLLYTISKHKGAHHRGLSQNLEQLLIQGMGLESPGGGQAHGHGYNGQGCQLMAKG